MADVVLRRADVDQVGRVHVERRPESDADRAASARSRRPLHSPGGLRGRSECSRRPEPRRSIETDARAPTWAPTSSLEPAIQPSDSAPASCRGPNAPCLTLASDEEAGLILGSTGSIGAQALDVVARSRRARRSSACRAERELGARCVAQAREHGVAGDRPRRPDAAERAAARPGTARGARRRGGRPRADRRLGRRPRAQRDRRLRRARARRSSRSARASTLALANKESLVVGGELVMALAEATGARIIPVDSEHSALYQLIARASRPGTVERLVLTASGGPVPRPHRPLGRDAPRRRSPIRPGRWAARSRSTRRR